MPPWGDCVLAGQNEGYRADLDGLRAVAVVAVILFHLNVSWVPGGFVGVDVFFVLSGYFITRQIVADLAENRFSFLVFYDRRLRRLLPALLVMFVFTAIASTLVMLPTDLLRFSKTLMAAALSISNLVFWQQSDYFASATDTAPLLHTWSLSVEEQFYIGFPLLLFVISSHCPRHTIAIVALISAASLALSLWWTAAFPNAAFYLLPSRAWELGIGCLLALQPFARNAPLWVRQLVGVAGLSSIIVAALAFDDQMLFPGLAALLPCLGAGALIWSGQTPPGQRPQRTTATWILTLPPLVFAGLISYGLYLWHWPIIALVRYTSSGAPFTWDTKLSIVVATFCFAFFSWKLVELPLRRDDRTSFGQRAVYGAAGITAAVLLGAGIFSFDGLPARMPANALAILQQGRDSSPDRRRCHIRASTLATFTYSQACVFGPSSGRSVIIYSDSHGTELSYALAQSAGSYNLRLRQITASGCPPSLNYLKREQPNCATFNSRMIAALKRETPATIILTAHFFRWAEAGSESQRDAFWYGFEQVVATLKSAGHEVVILGAVPPHNREDLAPFVAKLAMNGKKPADYSFPVDVQLARLIDGNLRAIAAKDAVRYIEIAPYICGDAADRCRSSVFGGLVYYDKNHLTVSTAKRLAQDVVLPTLLRWPLHITGTVEKGGNSCGISKTDDVPYSGSPCSHFPGLKGP